MSVKWVPNFLMGDDWDLPGESELHQKSDPHSATGWRRWLTHSEARRPLLAHAPYTTKISNCFTALNSAGKTSAIATAIHIQTFAFAKTKKQKEAFASKVERVAGSTILGIENPAGNVEASNIYKLAEFVRSFDNPKIRMILDTCHAFAAGFDWLEQLQFIRDNYDILIAIHLNDSKWGLGSHRDVHENLGRGMIGLGVKKVKELAEVLRRSFPSNFAVTLETPSLFFEQDLQILREAGIFELGEGDERSERIERGDERSEKSDAKIAKILIQEFYRFADQETDRYKIRAFLRFAKSLETFNPSEILPSTGEEFRERFPGIVGEKIAKRIDAILENYRRTSPESFAPLRNEPSFHKMSELQKLPGLRSEILSTKTQISELTVSDFRTPQLAEIILPRANDLIRRIPRMWIAEFEKKMQKLAKKRGGYVVEIAGSFRRGAKDSGDVDMVVSPPEFIVEIKHFLIAQGFQIFPLSEGMSKTIWIVDVPGEGAIQIDGMLCDFIARGAMLLYATGSANFNIEMRRIARSQNLKLNEHGIVNGEKLEIFETEQEIFERLGMEFVKPEERN